MSDDINQQLEIMVEKMPAFPHSVQTILEITSDHNCSPKELVQVIEHDPVMTVQILKLLNSAYYNLSRQITSIKHSVVYIGFNTIKNMALSIAAIGVMPKNNHAGFDSDQFLLHLLSTATIAETLGKRLNEPGFDKTEYFIGGLIHDFGKVVFAQFKPDEFGQSLVKCRNESIPLHQAEHEIIGADHSLVGSLLGKKWRFPKSLIACMGEHHCETTSDNAIRDCVIAANQISKKLALGDSGNNMAEELTKPVADRFGMGLEELINSLGDLTTEKQEVKAFTLI